MWRQRGRRCVPSGTARDELGPGRTLPRGCRSGVAADEQHRSDGDNERGVTEEECEARPGRQAVCAVGQREDRAARGESSAALWVIVTPGCCSRKEFALTPGSRTRASDLPLVAFVHSALALPPSSVLEVNCGAGHSAILSGRASTPCRGTPARAGRSP